MKGIESMLHEQTFNKRDAMKLLGMAEGLMSNLSPTIFPSGNDGLSFWTACRPGSKTNISSKTPNLNVRFAGRSSSKNEKWPLIGEGIAKEDIQPDASRCLKPRSSISQTTLSDGFGGQPRWLPSLKYGEKNRGFPTLPQRQGRMIFYGQKTKIMKGIKPMLNEQTFDKLYTMKLLGMAEGFKDQLEQPSFHDLSFEERFGILVDRQWTWKQNNRLQHLLKNAKLKLQACVEDIDYKTPRGIDKSMILTLLSCDWIRKHQNLLVCGPTGVGKTFLACAFAQKACREGFQTFYLRLPQFFYQIALARADGSYGSFMKKLSKTHLLVLDDLGLTALNDTERRDLLEVIEERHGSASTLLTSQLPVEHWHDHIGDPTIADAILDRLVHNAHRILLKGGSMRRKQKLDER